MQRLSGEVSSSANARRTGANASLWCWIVSLATHGTAVALASTVLLGEKSSPCLAIIARVVPAKSDSNIELPLPRERVPLAAISPAAVAAKAVALPSVLMPRVVATTAPAPERGLLLPPAPMICLASPSQDSGSSSKELDTGGLTPAGGASGIGTNTSAGEEVLSSRPTYDRTPLPVYPAQAKINRWEGVVVLRVDVMRDGSVGRVEIRKSSGHAILDRSAAVTVRHWRFHPATQGGAATECYVDVPVRFKLEDAGA